MEENNALLPKILRFFIIAGAAIFPLFYIKGFVFPATFPRALFMSALTTLLLALWLFYAYKQKSIVLKKSWISASLLIYIAILFIGALASGHFENSFFSSHERMTGISVTLYALGWYFILLLLLKRSRHWIYLLRAFLFSGAILALISYFGTDGVNWKIFRFLEQGGSLFGNTTFAGIYYFFAFSFAIILLAKDSSAQWRKSYLLAILVIVLNPDILSFGVWKGYYGIKELFSDPWLLLGKARASAISIALVSFFTAVFYLLHRSRLAIKAKMAVFGTILFALLALSFAFTGSVVLEKGFGHNFLVKQNDIERQIVWRQGVEAFYKHPILGYGYNNFDYAFQDTFRPEIAFLSNSNWFDKIHNGSLEAMVETGIAGSLAMLAVFISAFYCAFAHYRRKRDLSMPIVILVLIAHFIQIQTAFNTAASLFMIAVLLAYIASFELKERSYNLSAFARKALLVLGLAILTYMLVVAVITPAKQNRKIITAMRSGSFQQRVDLYQSLHSLSGKSPKMIFSVTEKFVNALFESLDSFNNPMAQQGLKKEFVEILDMYEANMDRHGDSFRFLINYANMIHIAKLFNVERMDRAEELIEQAKQISTNYPQVYWLATLHSRYVGDSEKALEEINKAIEMYENTRAVLPPNINETNFGRVPQISENIKSFIEESASSDGKVYYHLLEL